VRLFRKADAPIRFTLYTAISDMRNPIHILALLLLPLLSAAQDQWPMVLNTPKGTITIYQPQPESYTDGHFTMRAAFSAATKGKDPLFGALWATGFLEVDRETRMGTLTQLKVTDIRFPAQSDTAVINTWKDYLSEEIPKHTQPISIDRVVASLEGPSSEAEKPAYSMKPPEIIYANVPSVLVYIDGDPKFKATEKEAYERVVNTPYFIARATGKDKFYLGAAQLWYTADAMAGPWEYTDKVPKQLKELAPKDTSAAAMDSSGKSIIPAIVVRTTPTELIQTNGPADLKPIQRTELLYVTNSINDIFMEIADQQYYILVSGRWFKAPKLDQGGWTFVPGEQLPTDFAKIPEGSEKDNVLASVPGTQAAKEAVLDAQIPQTAKVDRTATTTITFDGEPKFKPIEGTTIKEAENASTTVLQIKGRYYACSSAVWCESDKATGPWKVCVEVPKEVQDIPPSSPSYNVKYVYVYDTTPEVVYVGYTPGYVGSYVYGPTVVYGTGYYYAPWYGTAYYPHPVTWGFSMHYNPWTGWGMGLTVSNGWLTIGIGGGGYWGPPMYRPPYYGHHYHGGYYGHGGGYHGGHNNINIDNSNNINVGGGGRGEGGRGDGIYDRGDNAGVKPSRPSQQPADRPGQGGGATRPSQQPAKGGGKNNVLTDRQGNVYRDNGGNKYDKMGSNGKWEGANKPSQQPAGGAGNAKQKGPTMTPDTRQQLDRDMQNRNRGQQRTNNYQNYQRSSPSAQPRGGGGGMRGGGGRR